MVASLGACAQGADPEPGLAQAGGREGTGRSTSGGVAIGPAAEGIDGVEAFSVDSNTHTEDDLDYDLRPPVGGDHYPVPGTCGFYDRDAPPDEMIVHSLEHGAVWIAYDPDLDEAQLTALQGLVAQQAKVIATPYQGLDSPLVVSAWGRQLALETVEDPRLAAFVDTYRNTAEVPEPEAPCQGAGEPAVTSPTA
jgi:hypothetical protein